MRMLFGKIRADIDAYSRRLRKGGHPGVHLKNGVNYVPVRQHYGYKYSQYATVYSI